MAWKGTTYISKRGAKVVEMKLGVVVMPVSGDLATFLAAPVHTTSAFETAYTVQEIRNDPRAA